MSKESALTEPQKNSIKLKQFIFHIIIKNADSPEYLDEVNLDDAQKNFFCERIADAAEGTQYRFRDEAAGVAVRCHRILESSNVFVEESKELAYDFFQQHKGNVSDGAFVIATFSIEIEGVERDLIALLKIDNQRVLEYTVEERDGARVAKVNEILQSFVEDRTALQKCAVVDLSHEFQWDLLAYERKRSTGIADYFRLFLGVTELETASNLTRMAVGTVGSWAQKNREYLPEPPRAYRTRAIQYMDTHDSFDTDSFLDMVVHDHDEERKGELTEQLKHSLQERGIAGQQFSPRPNSIDDRDRRNKVTTKEGVTVAWQGAQEAVGVDISDPDGAGIVVITVRTQGLVNDK